MRIAVDAMGGDFAPRAAVEGAWRAATRDGASLLLVGDEDRVAAQLKRLGASDDRIEIVHASEVVEMDESPITPIRRKRQSSIRICCELVRDGRAQALVTAGNTGAAMIAAKLVIGPIEGVDRPALAAIFPNPKGGSTVVLDVGANVETKPSHLRQFAVMGHFYAQELLGVEAPRIGVLSIGQEDAKGTDTTREALKVLRETGLNFIGNVEGSDTFAGTVDVILCDGFVGNAVLKSAESMASLIASMLRQEIGRSWRTRLGYLLARPAFERLRRRTDYRETGAVPLLGVRGGCFIGHGRSNPKAIRNSIRNAMEFCERDLHNKIRDRVAVLHSEEERLLGRATA